MDLKDTLFFPSDPKLNLISATSLSCTDELLVKEKTRGGVDLFVPKL